jgi:hypothetical protein
LAGCIELFVPSSKDFQVAGGEAIGRGDVTDGRMQAHSVVVGNKMLNQTLGIFKRQRAAWAQAAGFKGLVPALDFTVGLGVVRGGLDMSQASDSDELFEVTGNELRPVVSDNAGLSLDLALVRVRDDASAGRSVRLLGAKAAGRPHPQRSVAGNDAVQRKCDCGGNCPKCRDERIVNLYRSTGHARKNRLPHTGDVPEIQQSQGEVLPPPVIAKAEQVFSADLSRVRVHTGGPAHTAAARLGARAFTSDENIYFGAGFWQPQSQAGLALVGHELAHVLQQRRGLSGIDITGAHDAYEQEADKAGQSFVRLEPAPIRSAVGSYSALQRSEDPGVDATYVGVDDSPYDLPFLGEANTPEELITLMDYLSAEVGGGP